jgi:hypothetical protein
MSAISIVEVESNSEGIAIVEVRQGPVGPQGPPTGDLPRGQISIQGNTTATNIITIDAFVQAGIVGTLDTLTDIDFTALGSGKFGMIYNGAATRTFWITGSYDATAGNNNTLAIRMAKNGTSIPATECRAFTGSGGAEAKLVTTWMLELSTGNEVSLVIANTSSDADVTIRRGRLVINCIP